MLVLRLIECGFTQTVYRGGINTLATRWNAETLLMIRRILMVCVIALSLSPSWVYAVTIISENFDVATYTDLDARGWTRRFLTNVQTTDIVASPTHAGTGALRMTYAPGQDGANSDPYNSGISQNFAGQDEIWERWFIRYEKVDSGLPSSFVSSVQTSMKHHFFNDGGSGSITAIPEFSFNGISADSMAVAVNFQSGVLNNCPSGTLNSPTCEYPQNVQRVQQGIGNGHWYCMETHFKANTPPNADGIVEMWIDGVQTTFYNNIRFRSTTTSADKWQRTFLYRQGATNLYRYEDDYVLATTRVGGCGGGTVDTTPPSAPGSFAISADGSASWTASTDNVGVASYTVLFCTPAACTPSQTVTNTTALSATVTQTGDYAVVANDAAGNQSAQSNVVAFTAPTIFRTTLATDDFARANNTDIGAAWDAGYTSMTNFQIVSGILEQTSINTNSVESYNAVSAPNDQWCQIILHTISGSFTEQAGCMLRMSTPPGALTGVFCFAQMNNALVKANITLWNGTTFPDIGTSYNGTDWISGDTLDCEVQGTAYILSRIRAGVKTTLQSGTDATYASGRVGLNGWTATGGAVTDIQFGNFSFGGFSVSPPAQPSITSLTLDATGANVTWSSSPAPTQIRISDDRASVTEPLSSFPGGRYTWTQPIDGLTFKCFFAINSLGVENDVSTDYRCGSLVGIANPLDTTPPVMSNGLPSTHLPVGTTSTTISLSIDKPATCNYDTTDTTYTLMANAMTVSSLTASATVSGLTNGSTHTYYVRCQSVDAIGGLHPDLASLVITVIVDNATADTTPPTTVTNLVGTVLSSTQVSLQWTNATDNAAVAGYWAYLCFVSNCSDAVQATTTIVPTNTIILNLAPSTTYYSCVKAVDTSNNLSAACSNIITFTTGPVLDVTPPSDMTNLRELGAFQNSVVLTWDQGTDNSGSVTTTIEMSPSGCAAFSVIVSKLTLSQLVVNLSPSSTYCFRGKFSDASGNVSVNYSNILQVTTTSSGLPIPRTDVPFPGRSSGSTRSGAGTRTPR